MVKRRRAETQARRTRHRVGVKGLSIELEENGLNRDVVRQAEGVYVVVVAVVVGAVWSSLWSMETSLSTSSHGGQSMTSLFIFAPLIRVVMPIYGNCLMSFYWPPPHPRSEGCVHTAPICMVPLAVRRWHAEPP